MTPLPTCSKCSTELPVEHLNLAEMVPCPKCAAPIHAEVFPALFRTLGVGSAGETLMADSEASCFYHPQKKAAIICSSCGRYLCALCDVEFEGVHYCPGCLEAAQQKGALASLDNKRKLYDTVALQATVIGFMAPVPLGLFYVYKYWKAPKSILRGNPGWRMILALVISIGQCLFWLSLLAMFLFR